ncbi:MAG: glycosyl transferase [Candidatus Omnitrophica bacterium CG11_big_fil_rev_8_21_14_0_20_64_10]|nr:MAG: glycosyl transferase [Candidatus Omnitrophica bacterium CG11_big_fil_rev_8_21_14_0_20_64_10]
MKLSVVIPIYNEAGNVDTLLERVLAAPLPGLEKEVLVVNDASTDDTRQRLKRWADRVRVIDHPRNRGKGAAVRTGLGEATGELFLVQDADLEYDPNDYAALVGPVVRGHADVAMGSRFLKEKPRFFTKDGDPFLTHYLGNLLVIGLTNGLYGFYATDYEACYKVCKRSMLLGLNLQSNRFDIDNEIICKLLRRGAQIVEVPVQYNPRSYKAGKKIRWHHGFAVIWAIIKWRFLPF